MSIDKQSAATALRELLTQIADVVEMRPLTPAEREQVALFERQAEDGGAAGGVVPFVNEGVTQVLESEQVFAVLTGPMRPDPPGPWTVFLDDNDQLIGEWLPASRLEEARAGGRCIFLSEDFVMYRDVKPAGRGRFVMPFIRLEAGDETPFESVGVGCPSGPADLYLRSLLGEAGAELATLLLGVRFKQSDERET
jgi:hypothetical protein